MVEKKIRICDFCCDGEPEGEVQVAEQTCELCGKDFCENCGSVEDLNFGFSGDDNDGEEMIICNECAELCKNLFGNKHFKKKLKELIDIEAKKHLITKNLKKDDDK